MKPRILIVVHQFLPRYFAGTENAVRHTAHELIQRGHDVLIATTEPMALNEQPNWQGVRYDAVDGLNIARVAAPLKHSWRLARDFGQSPYARELDLIAASFKPDLIYVMHSLMWSSAIVPQLKKHGVPVFYFSTDFWLICPTSQLKRWDGALCKGPTNIWHCALCRITSGLKIIPMRRSWVEWVRHIIQRSQKFLGETHRTASSIIQHNLGVNYTLPVWVKAQHVLWIGFNLMLSPFVLAYRRRMMIRNIRWADCIYVPTQLMKNLLIKRGVISSHITIRHYGTPQAVAAPRPARPIFRFGFLGTFHPNKGAHVAIQAARHMQAMHPQLDFEFHFYGPVHGQSAYSKWVQTEAAHIRAVQFHGAYTDGAVYTILAEMDCVVIPSLWHENLPLVMLESFNAGVPIITSNVGGMTELVQDGVNGLTFPLGDAQALATCMARLLNEKNLLAHLKNNIRPPLSIGENVNQLLADYALFKNA